MNLPPRHVRRSALQRHHAALANEFYGDIVFRTRTIHCAITRRAAGLSLEDGGAVDQSVLMIRLHKTLFSEAPRREESVTHNGGTWLIQNVAGELAWEQEWVITVGKN